MDEVKITRGTATAVLTPSTKEDFAYINANLRDMDKFEQTHFREKCGVSEVDQLGLLEKSWTLHLDGEIVGFVALQVPPMQSSLSADRFVPMLSTKNVAHNPIDYVRLTRPVFEYVIRQAPAYVRNFYSLPLAKYAATVRWHEKTMGWHRVREFDICGEKAVLFHLNRKEIQ